MLGICRCRGSRRARTKTISLLHALWRSTRDEAKFERLAGFGEILPVLRQRVASDLAPRGLPKERVLAAIVRLLETTRARVGNPEYARTNGTFGLTTLRNRPVRIKGDRLAFDFRGKHGIQHNINLSDRRLAAIVRRCRDLPGQELFRFLDEDGALRLIGSEDVSTKYLKDLAEIERGLEAALRHMNERIELCRQMGKKARSDGDPRRAELWRSARVETEERARAVDQALRRSWIQPREVEASAWREDAEREPTQATLD